MIAGKDGNKIRIQIESDLTADKINELTLQIHNFLSLEENYQEIELDLEKVRYIDSMGITFVVKLYKTAEKSQKKFSVMNVDEDIIQLFNLIGLDTLFELKGV